MDKDKDGGQAFPSSDTFRPDGTMYGRYGMTLHDYFMAHAPAPQPWFQPEMPPKPKGAWESSDGKKRYASAFAAERECGDNFRNTAAVEIQRWECEYSKQRCVQWPAVWADEMLQARSKK